MSRVLLVEDDALAASAYTRKLVAAGHTVATADSALGAIDHLRREGLGEVEPIDIVLLDLGLRGSLSGLDVLKQIPARIHRAIISGTPAETVREREDPLKDAQFFFEKPLSNSDWRQLMHVIAAAGRKR